MVHIERAQDGLRELALFAGAGGGILGGKLLGWRTVCAVEIDEYARNVLMQRQDDGSLEPFPIWDDVTTFDGTPWRGRIDVVSGGFPCFVAGTLILTRQGFLPIESLCVGDVVLTHKGRWRPVVAVMRKDAAPIWCVRGTGILDTFTTAEHPYYVRKRRREWNNETRSYERKFCPPTWQSVESIDRDHFQGCVLPDVEEHNRTSDWWWLVGRYLADGWRVDRRGRKSGRVVICCGKHEREELSKRIACAGYHATEVEERTVFKFHITKGEFYEELAEFGRLAHGKTLPSSALCLDKERATSLWNGWISGDGWRNERGALWNGTTVSPSLALGMALVGQRATGRVASVYTNSIPSKGVIEGRIINQRTSYDVRICDRNRVSFSEGSYGWRPIKSASPVGILAPVYNISVAEDESYVANGAIVHNCQDISVAKANAAGIHGEKSGLWTHMARIIGEVRPQYVFVENSPMLRSRGLEVVLQDLAQMGYDARWGIMGAHHVGAPHKRDRMWLVASATSV